MLVRLYTHSGDSTNLWKRKAFIKWLIGRNKFGFRIRFLRQNFGKKAIVASAAIYLFDILISNVFQAPVDRSRVTVSFFFVLYIETCSLGNRTRSDSTTYREWLLLVKNTKEPELPQNE